MALTNSSVGYDPVEEGPNLSSTNAGDQILIKALQDLIVRVVDPRKIKDIDQIPMGPEAGKLIVALQEFVTSMIGHAESRAQHTVVEVDLDEDNSALQGGQNDDGGDGDGTEASLPTTSPAESNEDEIMDNTSDYLVPLQSPPPAFQDKLLKELRDHVFNTMPIRMLSFERHGSTLQITLLERALVYQRLVSALKSEIDQTDHVPIVNPHSQEMEGEQDVIKRLITKYTRYGILSHTWLRTSNEVTYGDWKKGLFDANSPGYQKLVNFCEVAWKDHGLTLGWMDTVCIDKDSSSELGESIRSMYNWYRRAAVCITYIAETTTLPTMHLDPWFTRGWTLQELLAPCLTKFYNRDWKQLVEDSHNDKKDTQITEYIERATTISKNELESIHTASISRRMQLAATREVTREEDTAYSLMGIFNVSFSTAYGEGADRAFFRLLQEILASPANGLDILNWAGNLPYPRPHASRIIPSSPLHYLKSSRRPLSLGRPMEPLTLTHLGLRVPIILMPAISIPGKASQYIAIGDYSATVHICPVGPSADAPNAAYNLLDKRIKRISGGDGPKRDGLYQLTLAVFNFDGNPANIFVMKTCIAQVLLCRQDVGNVTSLGEFYSIHTDVPVVFDLSNQTIDDNRRKFNYYRIKRDNLKKHGMQLVSLYL